MDKVDTLIKILAEFKEELNKNMNSSYGSTDQNMAKDAPDANATADIVRPDAGYGKVTVKDTSPKPSDPKRPYGKVIMKDEQQDQPKVNLNNPYNDQDEDEEKKKLKKASKDPALAPKEVKIKELQGKIDAGTYKPDAKKIADKMLKKTPNDASAAAPPVNGVPDMAKDEPHEDDPKHEAKEKKIASKVKEEAQDLLDMHKEELMCSANGQWKLMEKSIYNAGTHPMKGRESKAGAPSNVLHFDHDSSASDEENLKQLQAHAADPKNNLKFRDAEHMKSYAKNRKKVAGQ